MLPREPVERLRKPDRSIQGVNEWNTSPIYSEVVVVSTCFGRGW